MNPLVDFFTKVDQTYTQVAISMDTAQSGYNLDVAGKELSSARDAYSTAYDRLNAAKTQGFVTADQASDLSTLVMRPLADAIGGAAEAIQRGQSFILSYWETIKASLDSIVAPAINLVSSQWKDFLRYYRSISNYVEEGDALVATLQGNPFITQASIDAYRVELEKIRALKLSTEAKMQEVGVSVQSVKDAAANVDGLGVILDKVILGVTVGTILATIAKVVTAIFAVISGVGLFLAFAPGAASLVGLEALVVKADKARLEAEAKAQTQFQKDQAAMQAKKLEAEKQAISSQIQNTMNTMEGLSKVVPGQSDAPDKLRKLVEAERAKQGVSTGTPGSHVLLAVLGGLGLAGAVHYFRTRKA